MHFVVVYNRFIIYSKVYLIKKILSACNRLSPILNLVTPDSGLTPGILVSICEATLQLSISDDEEITQISSMLLKFLP